MYSLLKLNISFTRVTEQEHNFKNWKKIQQLPIKLSCDASRKGLGATLEQHRDQCLPIAYSSCAITDTPNRLIEHEGNSDKVGI